MNRLILGVTASAVSALLGSAGYLGAQTWTTSSNADGTITSINGQPIQRGSVTSIAMGGPTSGQYLISAGPPGVVASEGTTRTTGSRLPQGSAYHQTVDIYYDGDGNKLDAKSYTHRIDYDCNRNLRRQDENLMVQDDGKGNVRFVQSRLPSEPLTGVKPVTPDGMVKAQLAVKRSPPADIDAPVVASTPQLASKE